MSKSWLGGHDGSLAMGTRHSLFPIEFLLLRFLLAGIPFVVSSGVVDLSGEPDSRLFQEEIILNLFFRASLASISEIGVAIKISQ